MGSCDSSAASRKLARRVNDDLGPIMQDVVPTSLDPHVARSRKIRSDFQLEARCSKTRVWRLTAQRRCTSLITRAGVGERPGAVRGDQRLHVGPYVLCVAQPGNQNDGRRSFAHHARSELARRIRKGWCSGGEAQSAEQRTREAARTGKQPLDLGATACAIHTPFAKVLAIVRQDAIAAFAEARTCPCHHFATIEAWPIMSNPDAAAVREIFERNVFHRSANNPWLGPA